MATDLRLTAAPSPTASRRALLARRVRWFVAATITWNVVEAAVAITAGHAASSAALIGFGLDSIVEVLSAAAVAWQFTAADPETRERTALRIIAVSFFGLAAYVAVDAVLALTGAGAAAEHSTVGLVLAALSLLVMPFLSYGQRRAGRELLSRSAVADSKQTLLCTYLSGVLLVGLALNSLFGWSWADPIAALVIAAVAVKEGRDAWRGDTCCAPGPSVDAAPPPRTPPITRAASPTSCGCGDGGCAPTTSEPTAPAIACSLAAADLRDRIGEWRAVVADAPWAEIPGGVVVDVPAGRQAALVELIAAEQGCCPFLTFQVTVAGDVARVSITAPDEARTLVFDLLDPSGTARP
jgi:hypothetical protein